MGWPQSGTPPLKSSPFKVRERNRKWAKNSFPIINVDLFISIYKIKWIGDILMHGSSQKSNVKRSSKWDKVCQYHPGRRKRIRYISSIDYQVPGQSIKMPNVLPSLSKMNPWVVQMWMLSWVQKAKWLLHMQHTAKVHPKPEEGWDLKM